MGFIHWGLIFLLTIAVFVVAMLYKRESNKRLQAIFKIDRLEGELMKMHSIHEENKRSMEEAEILARVVRQSPNAIMLMDANGNIQMVNQGFNRMYEYSFNEFTAALGTNYRQTSFSPDVQHRLDTVARTKMPFRYEALNVTRTGKELWTQTALMPILDSKGEISHLATIDTDIHQRVVQSDQVISEMERLNEHMDHLAQQFKFMGKEFHDLFTSINELYSLIENTDQILKFIREISDQTRILGFNASIEAGRAGEHGRGFRVITSEIVDISAKTIHSVGQINDILDSIQTKQTELLARKDDSEHKMSDYQSLISELKREVRSIEAAIAEFKSLT
jgi:PAS domain S-box-containing protein